MIKGSIIKSVDRCRDCFCCEKSYIQYTGGKNSHKKEVLRCIGVSEPFGITESMANGKCSAYTDKEIVAKYTFEGLKEFVALLSSEEKKELLDYINEYK